MSKQSVKIEGVEYKSRTEAAKALVAAGKTLAEAAAATGMTYQTVYANTKGAEKVNKRRAKYRVLSLGRGGNRTTGEIAKKTGLSTSAVVALLKKAGITIVTKESKAAEKKATKATKVTKTPKAPKTDEVPVTPEQVLVEDDMANDEIPMDADAEAQAMVDMVDAN